MKLRGPLIAMVILAALTGFLYWSNHHKPGEDSTVKASLNSAPQILSLKQADVVQVAIQRKDQGRIDLTKNDSGVWQITEPSSLAADQEAVSSLLSTLTSLDSDRLVEEKTPELGPYGLLSPALVVTITLKDKKTQKLLIGDRTPTGSAFYAMLAGNPRLFTVASYNESSLDKGSNDLRDKRLFTEDFDKVSQIELTGLKPGKKDEITFAREKDAWQILKPKPYRTDSLQVDELIRSLKDAKIEISTTSDEKTDAAIFQSAMPFASAKVVGASGTQEIEVRKAKDDYYCRSSILSGVYKVPSSVATGLDKTLNDFRNKKLFDFGYADPDKIEFHGGDKSYFLTRSGSDWWGPDGKKLDSFSASALLDKIRDLSASKFPDSGFTVPTLRLTVVSNDKKRTETLLIAKNKEDYIAKRDGEPALYEISSSSVADLQKAASSLKPLAEPASNTKK